MTKLKMPTDHYKFRGADIYLENSIEDSKLIIEKSLRSLKFNYPCVSPSKCTPYVIHLTKGQYLLQVFGASGGDEGNLGLRGLGGFSQGLFDTKENTRLYLYIGGEGTNKSEGSNKGGGYNGGGLSYGSSGGGVGATDFRTIGGVIDSSESIESRILIAGGGGGARFIFNESAHGGNGGGFEGTRGGSIESENQPCYGNQNDCLGSSGPLIVEGSLWKGADANSSWGFKNGGAGGGGGYYGGGTCAQCGGSGGSGFSKLPMVKGMTYPSNNAGNGYAVIYFFNSFTFHNSCRNFPLKILHYILILK